MENQGTTNQVHFNQAYDQQQQLPNATAVLVLGILSIVGCFCYGMTGIVLGIIAIVLAAKAKRLYELNPSMYTEASYKNMKSGRVCAIIGLSISAVYIVILIIYLVIIGTALSAVFGGMML